MWTWAAIVKKDCWRGNTWYPLCASLCQATAAHSLHRRKLQLRMVKRPAQGHTVAEQELYSRLSACNPSITLVLRKVSCLLSKQVPITSSAGRVGAATHSRDGAAKALGSDRSY